MKYLFVVFLLLLSLFLLSCSPAITRGEAQQIVQNFWGTVDSTGTYKLVNIYRNGNYWDVDTLSPHDDVIITTQVNANSGKIEYFKINERRFSYDEFIKGIAS